MTARIPIDPNVVLEDPYATYARLEDVLDGPVAVGDEVLALLEALPGDQDMVAPAFVFGINRTAGLVYLHVEFDRFAPVPA